MHGLGRSRTWVVVAHVVVFIFFDGVLFRRTLLQKFLDVIDDPQVDFGQVPSQVVVHILVDFVPGGVSCDPVCVSQLSPLLVELDQLGDRQV